MKLLGTPRRASATAHAVLLLMFFVVAISPADGTAPGFSHQPQQHRDRLAASGLLHPAAAAARLAPSKYASAGTRPAWDLTRPGTFFAGSFSDHAVLQRAPQLAAIYGVVIGAQAGTDVVVTVASLEGSGSPYTVAATVDVTKVRAAGGSYARWKALLNAAPAGGNFTITVACSTCANTTAVNITDVTFGDVFFCSGQSNMWLPMHMDTSRNHTYDAVLQGKYANIRMLSVPHNNQPDGGFNGTDLDIMSPPPPRAAWGGDAGGAWLLADVGTYANASCRAGLGDHGCQDRSHCCTGYPQPNDDWLFNSIDQFSAACWHFAEQLTDMAELKGEPIIPYGLIGSHWGGTMVEHWQPNATLNAGVCKNSSGGAYAPWQNRRWDIDSGALYNGMVRPLLNTTIRGALWYQGENNVFQCHDASSTAQSAGGSSPGGGPAACGDVKTGTGYACMMKNLVDTWRSGWSTVPGTTPRNFPFGIVTLAGGTSEGHANNMGAFRYAQQFNTFLSGAENVFNAQAFDAGDPCSGGGKCCTNSVDGSTGWPCMSGDAPYTSQFMGGIHPRVKKIVGTRLAKAARKFVYGDDDIIWTGPVLRSCTVQGHAITLNFDQALMKEDAVMVLPSTTNGIPMDYGSMGQGGMAWPPAMLPLLAQLGPESPMQIQLNGDPTNVTAGVWLPVRLTSKCMPPGTDQQGTPPPQCRDCCSWNSTSNTKLPGWDQVEVPLPPGLPLANVTGIRYAWGENPCCPSINRFVVPCPPNSCPIQTYNSSMPAVPFWATITSAACNWISTQQ